jgi:hypothetical protein
MHIQRGLTGEAIGSREVGEEQLDFLIESKTGYAFPWAIGHVLVNIFGPLSPNMIRRVFVIDWA